VNLKSKTITYLGECDGKLQIFKHGRFWFSALETAAEQNQV
jgi:hypothetical protein